MQLGDFHKPGAPFGTGRCSKPMWWGDGMPAGFCSKPAYGKQTKEGYQRLLNQGRSAYAGGLACPDHGGPTLSSEIKGRIVIRFDRPPSHESGRFIEIEKDGASFNAGDWVQDGDDWLLVLNNDKLQGGS